MATTPPTGTHTPTRPGTAPEPEQLDLFDAAALVASIEERLGRWGGTYSVALTLTLDAALNRLLSDRQHGRRKVARATLIAMGGRGWTDVPSEIVAYVAGMSPGRARGHHRHLVAAGILERDPARPRTWRPGPVTRLAMPQIVSRAPGAREISAVSRAPGARGTQRPERDHHQRAHARAENRAEPQRLPWLTDRPCPTCATGRLARKPGATGELDEVCKACRAAERAAATVAPAPDRGPERCTRCGAKNRTIDGGRYIDPCDACAGPAGGR